MLKKSPLKWLWLTVLVIVLDQASKLLVDHTMDLFESIPLIPLFQLTYVRNTGAAFSLLAHAGGWQRWFFIVLSLVASVGISYWINKLPKDRHLEASAWALVLGGALGNLIDRIAYGYVIDFLDAYYQQWHFPAFNVADSAITVGVGMLLIDAVLATRHSRVG